MALHAIAMLITRQPDAVMWSGGAEPVGGLNPESPGSR